MESARQKNTACGSGQREKKERESAKRRTHASGGEDGPWLHRLSNVFRCPARKAVELTPLPREAGLHVLV